MTSMTSDDHLMNFYFVSPLPVLNFGIEYKTPLCTAFRNLLT